MANVNQFKMLVKLCIEAAEAKYGALPELDIRFDLKGRAAGMAGYRGGRFYVRFNREAMELNWEHMVQETIPHEIAHIVAFAKPSLGAKGHNPAWRAIAQSLGCKGERCHTMNLTPARKVRRYFYKLDSGMELMVGPKHHKQIQLLGKAAGIKVKRTGERLDRHHFKTEGHRIAA